VATSDEVWTYRPRSAVPAVVAVWVLAVGLTAAQGVAGSAATLRAVPFGLAAALAGWLVFYRPHVRVDAAGVRVVNPLRSYDVPWEALIEITTRYTCTLVTPTGRVEMFAAPGPSRQTAVAATVVDLRHHGRAAVEGRRSISIGELPRSASGTVAAVVRRRWQERVEAGLVELGVADSTPVARRTDRRAAGLLAALVAVGLLAVLIR
jgi:hypothetical protein